MRYVRLYSIALVMFGLAGCGFGDDPKKEEGEDEDMVVIDTDGENADDDTTDDDTDTDQSDQNQNNTTDETDETDDPGNDQVCGNGVVDADEACDDGNTEARDGCSDACEIETVVFRNLETALERSAESGCNDFGCDTEYRITLTLNNFAEEWVQEVNNIRVTIGGYELSSGGIQCSWQQWQVEPLGRSEVISFEASYDAYYDRLRVRYPCDDEYDYDEILFNPEDGDKLSEMATVEVEITGLLEDGAVWTTAATTDVRDLR